MEWYAILGLVVQAAILLIVILILSIWVYLSLSQYCCFRYRLRGPWEAAGLSTSTRRGLKTPEIERLPKFSFNENEKIKCGVTECAVCLGAFMEDETLRLIPVCGHVFHADCVDVWLRSRTTCPCCRANLNLPPPDTTADQSPV